VPPALDERRIRHDGGSPRKPAGRRGRDEPPQFTLGGLLAFFTAITVSISLAATGVKVMGSAIDLGLLLFGLAGVVTWSVLYVTYRKLRLRGLLILHWLGLGVGAGLALSLSAPLGPSHVGPPFVALLAVLCYGWALGSVVSVPVFILTMVDFAVWNAIVASRSQSQLPPESEQPPQLVEQPPDHLRRVRREDGEP